MGALALPGLAASAPGWTSTEISPTAVSVAGAIDRAGTVQLVYVDIGDQGYVDRPPPPSTLMSAIRVRGGPWQPSRALALPPGLQPAPNVLPPAGSRVLSNDHGDLVVVAPTSDRRTMLVTIRRDGAWSAVHAIATGSAVSPASPPSVAVNNAGEILLAWSSRGRVRAAMRTADGSWTGPVVLAPARPLAPPTVALNTAGDALVAWSRRLGHDRFTVAAADRRSDGGWSPPRTAVPPSPKRVQVTAVALDAAGDGVATYEIPTSVDGRSPPIAAAAEHAAGSAAWGRRTRLGRGFAGQVVMDAAGTAVATWGSGSQPAQIAVRPPGGRWRLEGPLPGAAGGPQALAVTPYGDLVAVAKPREPRFAFLAVWQRSAGESVWRRAPADIDGGPVGPGFEFALGPAGDVVLTWVGAASNSLNTLIAASYEAPPKPLLTRLQAPGRPSRAAAVRLRIGLSSPGRALVTISPAGRRRVVGAFVASIPAAGRSIGLPPRVRGALHPGRYTVTVDTGGTPLASARRTIPLHITGD